MGILVQWLMNRCGFDSVWCCHGISVWWDIRVGGRPWHVGVWTGPEKDLICVKRCETNGEAKQWLSPGSRSLLIAAIKSALLRRRLARQVERCPRCGALPGEYHRTFPRCPDFWEPETVDLCRRVEEWTGRSASDVLRPAVWRPS